MNRLKNFVCREGFAEVDTRAGRLRGFLLHLLHKLWIFQ